MFYKDHAQYDLLFKSSRISETKFFRLKFFLLINQLYKGSPENLMSGLCFSSFMDQKKQKLRC